MTIEIDPWVAKTMAPKLTKTTDLAALAASALLLLFIARPIVANDAELRRAREFEQHLIQSIARAAPTLVILRQPRGGRASDNLLDVPDRAGGSGVIVDSSGFILTNDHVVEEGDKVLVTLRNGNSLPAVVWARDRGADLALVKVKAPQALVAASFGDSKNLKAGEPVFSLGNALGLSSETGEPAASLGIVSGLERFQGGTRVYSDAIQFDAAVNPGNSGGGLFNCRGELLGLTGRISIRAGESRSVGVGFAVPIHRIKRVLPKLIEGQDIRRGAIGIRFNRDDPGPGVRLSEVIENGAADAGGLRAGDIVLAVGDRKILISEDLQNAIADLFADESVSIRVRRGLEEQSFRVKADARGTAEPGFGEDGR